VNLIKEVVVWMNLIDLVAYEWILYMF
jgi:hypothetical protein